MGLLLYLILIYGIYRVASKAFKFEKVSRFEQITLPGYSLIMFLITMSWKTSEIGLLVLVVVLSALIGWYQASGVTIQRTAEHDKFKRPIVLVKQNWPYIVGWVAVFVLGIACEIWHVGRISNAHILRELGEVVREELFTFMKFGNAYSWYIWAISAVSGFTYMWVLHRKEPEIAAAIQRPDRH